MVCPGRTTPTGNVAGVPYTVSTPVFEGPLDLLLHLVTREQVDLWEVSLSDIVDAYVATLEAMQAALDLEVATEFLLIAAVLLELKARRLLPDSDNVDVEEELARWEERDLLLARLLECKTFKDASGAMHRLMDAAGRRWPRLTGVDERYQGLEPDVLGRVSPEQLRDAMQKLLAPKPGTQLLLDHVAPIRVSVRDAVDELLVELPLVGRTTFFELTRHLMGRLDVIVRFLALLELCKQGQVDLEQAASFAELQVCWIGPENVDPGLSGFGVEEYQG
jgi:segregation and condensation protein A